MKIKKMRRKNMGEGGELDNNWWEMGSSRKIRKHPKKFKAGEAGSDLFLQTWGGHFLNVMTNYQIIILFYFLPIDS